MPNIWPRTIHGQFAFRRSAFEILTIPNSACSALPGVGEIGVADGSIMDASRMSLIVVVPLGSAGVFITQKHARSLNTFFHIATNRRNVAILY